MPSEMRRLIFHNQELIAAMSEYIPASKQKLPTGTVTACTPVSEADVAVRLELVEQSTGERHSIDLSPEAVGAALVRYCINRRIPLPKNAAKSIRVHGDTVTLDISLKAASTPHPEGTPHDLP